MIDKQRERLARRVERIRHEAHLAYQRQALAQDTASTQGVHALACPEQRGCRYVNHKPVVFNPAWFTHLRENFWRAFVETTVDVQRHLSKRA